MVRRLIVCVMFATGMAIVGCGGSSGPPPDFSLTATPATVNLTGGGSPVPVSVSAGVLNGFNGNISVQAAGLPTGVTVSPASLTLVPGTAQNLTFTASQSAPAATATVTLTATSGLLSHSATVAVTVTAYVPPPSFTLSVTPQSLTLNQGGPGQPVTISAAGANGFTSAVNITFTGLPAGVSAIPAAPTLTPGTPQQVTFSAASTATLGAATVTIQGASGALNATASLALTVAAPLPPPVPDVTTYHYDNARTGQNLQETVLTPSNVNSAQFGKTGFINVDGKVDAEPLFLYQLSVAGQLHNVLYIATEHDTVYAFDADTGSQLWQHSILPTGERPSDARFCFQISPEIGITSTPVIDRKQGPNGTIFVVGMSWDGASTFHQRIHALDLTTGADLTTTEVKATYPGTGANTQNGSVVFDPGQYAERASLLLLNGVIYTGWTSHCDIGAYTGWLIGYDEKTLQQTSVLNLTPNGKDGSIWMSGAGLAADSSGNIYFLDANGTFDTTLDANGFPSKGDFGNAFLKVSTASGKLAVADYFERFDTVNESNGDTDLGSGGALLLPDLTDAAGKVRHLAVGAGKDQNLYVVDRDNMGKFSPNGDSAIYQESDGTLFPGIYSMPAYFNGTLYYGPFNEQLQAFSITNARVVTPASSRSPGNFGYPGATPGVSANGTSNGIVWAAENGTVAALHAYDATNLGKELYNSNQAPNGRDTFGAGNKFITPLIVNGKVYVGTTYGVAVFGLLH